jgi:hypothetical protein
MAFDSVFNSISEVSDVIESDRVNENAVLVNVDKMTVGIYLDDSDLYFDGFEEDSYYMSPGGEHEKQVLFYDSFRRVEELVVELLSVYLGDEVSVNYRGDESISNLVK